MHCVIVVITVFIALVSLLYLKQIIQLFGYPAASVFSVQVG